MLKDLIEVKQKKYKEKIDEIDKKIQSLEQKRKLLEEKYKKSFWKVIDKLKECCLGVVEPKESSANKSCPMYCPFLEVITEYRSDDDVWIDSINSSSWEEIIGHKCHFPKRYADVKRELEAKYKRTNRFGD